MILSRSTSVRNTNSTDRGLTWKPSPITSSRNIQRSRRTFVRSAQFEPVSLGDWIANFLDQFRDTASSASKSKLFEEDSSLENAVLLFGSTGKTGVYLLQKLLDSGRMVRAAVRSSQKLKDLGVKGSDRLQIVDGVDMKEPSTMNKKLFEGITQVVLCTGPVLTPNPAGEGPPTLSDSDTPESVDKNGVINVVKACEEFLPKSRGIVLGKGLDLTNRLESWEAITDVENGGKSTISARKLEDGEIMIEGETITDGKDQFGFAQYRSYNLKFDLTDAYGVHFRVKGDGDTYFLCFKTREQTKSKTPLTFVAPFETQDGEWTDVYIPLHEFIEVTSIVTQPYPRRLEPTTVVKVGFLASRYVLNKFPNKSFKFGKFSLTLDSTLYPYSAPKPQVVLMSSAAVERNAKIGSNAEAREKEIPIVRLNPGGILGFKYDGENALRASSLLYSIVRPHGFIQENEESNEPPTLLEFGQGDRTIGRIKREEVADVMLQCTQRPESVNKTFECRRKAGLEAKDKEMDDDEYLISFLGIVKDEERAKIGLPPFPKKMEGADGMEVTEKIVQNVIEQQRDLRSKAKELATSNV